MKKSFYVAQRAGQGRFTRKLRPKKYRRMRRRLARQGRRSNGKS